MSYVNYYYSWIFFIIYSIHLCPIYAYFIISGSYVLCIAEVHCMCFCVFNESLFVLSNTVSFFISICKSFSIFSCMKKCVSSANITGNVT